jgi:hypothetical protein
VAIECAAVDPAFGPALAAVLLSVSVLGVLTVEASFLVVRAVVHPPIAVTVETAGPAFAAAVATGHAAGAPAAMA